jgi:hypothetical protein
MAAERRGRRWLTAIGVTLAAHLLVFAGLVVGTPKWRPIVQTPIFQVSLERERPVPAPPKVAAAARPAAPSPVQVHQPPAVMPNAPIGILPAGPAAAAPIAPTPPIPAPVAPTAKLKLDCLHMGPAARRGVYGREDCEVQRFAKVPGADQVHVVPSNPAWDAQIANRMRKHEPLPPEKPFRGDCANSNLGMGCPGDMLIPLTKKAF